MANSYDDFLESIFDTGQGLLSTVTHFAGPSSRCTYNWTSLILHQLIRSYDEGIGNFHELGVHLLTVQVLTPIQGAVL